MKRSKNDTQDAGELRRRAEERFAARRNDTSSANMGPETQRLLHELQVHQIELEMQNEELERARIEVEEGLRRYTDLYEFAPVGYLTLSQEGEIRQVNLTGTRLLGLERSHLVGKRLAVLVDADSRAVFNAFLTKVFENGTKEACEVVVRPELRSPFAVELSAVASARGTECRVVATDITARKRSEALLAVRLRLQEFASSHSPSELLQKTLDEVESVTGSRLGFFHYLGVDQRTPLLQVWSTRTVSQFGTAHEQLGHYGAQHSDIWADCVRKRAPVIHNDCGRPPGRDAPPSREGSAGLSPAEPERGKEWKPSQGFHVDHRTPMIREVVVPIFREGKIVAILGVGNKETPYTTEDVSTISFLADMAWEIAERRRVEQEREQLQLQLAQAQKMEAIGTLAGGIAHDFNNILAAVLGGLTLLELEFPDGSAAKTDIEEMKGLVNRGVALTKQLLGFARLGKYDLMPLDLKRVVAKTSAMYGRARADITIQLDFAPDLLAVLMDHSQLEQVLLNLLVNAGQAMPQGGQLILRAENADLADDDAVLLGVPPGRYAKLLVTDTGSGMDAKTMGRIFEPFFTTKGPGQGTGLGLASVYGIIKNHAGFIGVESEMGKGTTFTLLLPATERQVAEDKTPTAVLRHGTGTILVVDDEPQIVKVCARLLERSGYQVLTASGGREAIELVRRLGAKISLVLLDMTMPEMSGRQSYETLQGIIPGLKVLLSSGWSIEGQAQELLDRGCNGFIQKPFEAVALSAKVREILEQPANKLT
jgi:PAS domain S-box-containing protein